MSSTALSSEAFERTFVHASCPCAAVVADLKRKSVVGGVAAVSGQGAKICSADGNDDGAGEIVIT